MARTKISKAENDSKAIEKPVKERKPRTPTAYNNFVKNFYAQYQIPDGEEKPKPKEMISMAAAAWKELSEDEKAEYKTPLDTEDVKIVEDKPKKTKKKDTKKSEDAKTDDEAEEKPKKTKKKDTKKSDAEDEE